jgi:triacylglycerol lipase
VLTSYSQLGRVLSADTDGDGDGDGDGDCDCDCDCDCDGELAAPEHPMPTNHSAAITHRPDIAGSLPDCVARTSGRHFSSMRLALVLLLVLACAAVPACSAPQDPNGPHDAGRVGDARVDGGRDASANADDAADPPDTGPPHTLGPPYPIVFAHGFFGFQHFAGIDYIDYFFHVEQALAMSGETNVYFPAVDPFNTSEVRGAQLADQIQQILDTTGYRQVVIVGHSQGGLDARVVAHDHPEWVAAVYTIATPHGGTAVSDVVDRIVSDPRLRDALDAIAGLVFAALYDAAGDTTSVWLGLDQFNTPNIATFDAAYPDAPTIPYYSIGGRSALNRGGSECNFTGRAPFLARYDTVDDPIDPLLSVTGLILNGGDAFNPIPNDGLVSVPSSRHGTFLGCIPADHLDEIGQLFGDSPGGFNDFDHYTFYRDLVAYIRASGV